MTGWALRPLVSGIGICLAFPGFSLFPLAWVTLAPYLQFLLETGSRRRILAGHLIFSSLYFGGVLYWIPRVLVEFGNLDWFTSALIFGLMILLLDLFLLPFSLLTHAVARRSAAAALWSVPGLWILTELLRNYYTVNGFPWALVGHTQFAYHWIAQVADLSGVYLISFLVLLGNAALVAVLRNRSWRIPAVFALCFAGANLYGIYRCHVWTPPPGMELRVALVQPDVGLFADGRHYAKKYFDDLPRHYARAVEAGVDWVIFPEAQNPYLFTADSEFRTFWRRQVQAAGVPLVMNVTSIERPPSNRYFNSAYLLEGGETVSYRYDKIHLVPFGEYVPMAEWLAFASPLVQEVGGFQPGQEYVLGQVSGVRFATLICFEGIFPELARDFVRNGAEILVNITNDTWYGRTAAPMQHFQFGAFRAIEQRRPLLRCANSGYSSHIDATGAVRSRTGLFEERLLIDTVQSSSYRSVYSRVGEWINMCLAGLALLGLVFPRGRR